MKRERTSPFVHLERRSELIGVDDLRHLFRLEGELCELPRGSEQQRLHALTGLASLVGAQVGIWGRFGGLVRDSGRVVEAVHLGWSGDRERRVYLDYLRDGQVSLPDPSVPLVARALDDRICTLSRGQLITDRAWYREPHVQEYRRACGLDAFMHSVRVDRDAGYVISLHRPWGARPFSERERRLVDLFHRESRALVPAPPPPSGAESPLPSPLPPQLQRTLEALLRGLSEKEVAAELGLSQHTVHEYVGVIYRRFGVRSRGELFAQRLGHR